MGLLTNQRRFMGDTGYIIITKKTNPKLLKIMHEHHLANSPNYMTIYEARNVVNEKFTHPYIFKDTDIETFDEFKYFTNVTKISKDVFSGCEYLSSITFPESITSIESAAFENCSNLISVTLPDKLEHIEANTFSGCSKLTMSSFPDSIIDIGEHAFEGCINLDLQSLSSNLISINNSAFAGCTKLTLSGGLSDKLTNIGEHAFENCESLILGSLPSKLTTINNYVFNGCTNLKLDALPENLSSIGEYAFENCVNMTLSNLPDKLVNIYQYAFKSCTSALISSLPNTLKKIGEGAFQKCESMIIDTFPNNYSLNKVEPYVFDQCTNISISTLPDSVKVIDHHAFSSSGVAIASFSDRLKTIGDYAFENCENIYDVEFSNSIWSIGSGAFQNCKNLNTTALPTDNSNFKKIQPYTFQGCSALTLGTLPGTIEFIENYAFAESGVTFSEFSDSLKEIAMYSFQGCSGLGSLTFPKSLYNIAEHAFQKCENLKISALPKNKDYWEVKDYSFEGCTNLGLPEIKENIYIIGDYAFKDSGIAIEKTPGTVGYIGINAFSGCKNITKLEVCRNNEGSGHNRVSYAAYDKIIQHLRNNKHTVGLYAGYNSEHIFNIDKSEDMFGAKNAEVRDISYKIAHNAGDNWVVPDYDNSYVYMSIYIESGAFEDCTSLTKIQFGDDNNALNYRHYISENLCNGCTSLNEIFKLPCSQIDTIDNKNVECCIGPGAFEGCGSLSITTKAPGKDNNGKLFYMPNNITIIENNAFKGCENLILNSLPSRLTKIGDYAFANACNDVVVSDNDKFKNGAFYNLFKDNKVLTSIGNNAFEGCINISTINIWDSIESIGEFAFNECNGVTNLILSAPIDANNPQPNNLSSVGQWAFANMGICSTINTYIPWNSDHNWIIKGGNSGIFSMTGETNDSVSNELNLYDKAIPSNYTYPKIVSHYDDPNKCWYDLFHTTNEEAQIFTIKTP